MVYIGPVEIHLILLGEGLEAGVPLDRCLQRWMQALISVRRAVKGTKFTVHVNVGDPYRNMVHCCFNYMHEIVSVPG
jgi:hypothetical protein